ncbi:glycosyltransferase [Azospirillum sp. Sh1]|uniref:glycosyltransferase n=1 Tax=Azospirillum sp. Sh1 TaxID=2607285 RepID=UPI0011EEC8D7|nr:glycosyltransferase [Azospirillum sp. Sh1]KAA0579246.1 glycosyltransferase [Azospirillum sp. Sh1]
MERHKIFFDARCLQDPNYKYRGVGRHSSNMCIRPSADDKYVLVACCSRSLPPLPPEYEALFDQVLYGFPRNLNRTASIVSLSPMTDSTDFATRPDVGNPLVSASLIYDFIPWDHYGYLGSKEAIDGYCKQVSALNNFELFFPISDYSGRRLAEICKVPAKSIVMTGVGVHDDFYEADSLPADTVNAVLRKFGLKKEQYLAFVGGGDPRKNADLVVELAGRYSARTGGAVPLVIGGQYPYAMRDALTERYRDCGGRADGITFLPHVSDTELAALYRGSLATVVASLIEGFSLPVVEAIAAGSIALVSDCDAHLELVSTQEAIFKRTDADDALAKLTAIAGLDAAGRTRLKARQQEGVDRFRMSAVRDRFWAAMDKAISAKQAVPAPAPLRRKRPRLAISTPWPPQKSGVATYSFNTIKALSRHAEVDVYCDVAPADAPPLPGVRLLPTSERIGRGYDRTYFVIGNSHFHTPMINRLLECGGTAIIHDSRLFEYYFTTMGGLTPQFNALATRMIGREIAEQDVQLWLRDQRTLPNLFLEDVIGAASDIIVHHPGFAREIVNRYRRQPQYIPFAIPPLFEDADLDPELRQKIRSELNLSANALSIATFGYVAPVKGPTECIFALGELQDWKIPANLYFVGGIDPDYKEKLLNDARFCGVEHAVHFFGDYASDDIYRKFLLAADCGIQLRKIGFGQGSGAIAECAAAGIATIANNSIAESVESPAYVRRVPDVLSPPLIAEQILNIHEQGLDYARVSEERDRYVNKHSFEHYAIALLESV